MPRANKPPPEDTPLAAAVRRVDRLEEAITFTQGEHDDIKADVLDLRKRLDELARRVAMIESSLRSDDTQP